MTLILNCLGTSGGSIRLVGLVFVILGVAESRRGACKMKEVYAGNDGLYMHLAQNLMSKSQEHRSSNLWD